MPLRKQVKKGPPPSAKGTRLGKYTLGNEIGKGGFGTVYECLTDEGQLVAVKRMRLKNLPKEMLASMEMEISLLKKLNHKNIVQYIDTVRTRDHLHNRPATHSRTPSATT